MDKHTIIGLLIIFAMFLGYSFYSSHKAQEAREKQLAEQELQADKKAKRDTTKYVQLAADSLTGKQDANAKATTPTSVKQQSSNSILGYVDSTKNNDFVVRTNKAEYHFSRYGGYVKSVLLKDIYKYAPEGEKKDELVMFQDNTTSMSIPLRVRDSVQSLIYSDKCYFTAEKDTVDVKSGTGHLRLYLHPYKLSDSTNAVSSEVDNNAYVMFDYTFKADEYMLDYTVRMKNMSKYLFKQSMNLDWKASLYSVEKNVKAERDLSTLYYMDNRDEVENLNERASDSKEMPTELKWVSFKQQFFTSILIAKNQDFRKGKMEVKVDNKNDNDPMLKKMESNVNFDIADFDNGQFDMQMYYGPNQYKVLKGYDMNLEKLVPLGWGFFLLHWINRFIVIPIFNWLEAYGISYGIIILILSIFIKIVILPLAYKTYLSSAKMRVLRPQIEELNAKFPKPEDAMKKQQATMTLYKKAGISPMGGCVPMLIQMPILIAMYRFFPAAYELRQQGFLWAEDLSTYDSILNLSFSIPFYGDHVSLFTLLMTAATLVYTWLNNRLMSVGNNDQMKMMKWMMYLMPILFLGMFNSFSSALTYYYLLINLITFLQMWIFRMAIDEKKLLKKMETNMVKPVKKTKWQARMEEMIKQQQQLQQQQQKRK
ncbi:MAG: membrane protein insertase YidC [Bacteroidales bacterium]|nr:membrane protein insertase YidC [Bacteroidales bacterium]